MLAGRAPEQRPERATSRFMAEMEPQDDSLTNDELAAKVETMERTCELLDEQLAAMRAAESALQSRGAATAKATTVARHATARVEHLQSESSALQHRCSTRSYIITRIAAALVA